MAQKRGSNAMPAYSSRGDQRIDVSPRLAEIERRSCWQQPAGRIPNRSVRTLGANDEDESAVLAEPSRLLLAPPCPCLLCGKDRPLTINQTPVMLDHHLPFACRLFGLECEVWMVGSSYDQKPYRRSMMETWGATVHRSPSELAASGRAQQEHPAGSLGIAISEAVEAAAQNADTNYSLGSC
jgi:hypothetical protein